MKIISKTPPELSEISYKTVQRCNMDVAKVDRDLFTSSSPLWRQYKVEDYAVGETRYVYYMDVPCGKCLECLSVYSTEWAYRIMDECSKHLQNCFLTLTYEETPVSLQPDDLTKFIKRLRKKLDAKYGLKIRYFACGEYGSKGNRPHYHMIVFGWIPDDLKLWSIDKKGTKIYRSAMLEELWPYGFSSVGEVTLLTAKYCAKYLQKLSEVPEGCVPPFTRMSLRPGIGASAVKVSSLASDKVYRDGHYTKTPRYYLKLFDRQGFSTYELKEQRYKKAIDFPVSEEDLEKRREKMKKLIDKPLNLL